MKRYVKLVASQKIETPSGPLFVYLYFLTYAPIHPWYPCSSIHISFYQAFALNICIVFIQSDIQFTIVSAPGWYSRFNILTLNPFDNNLWLLCGCTLSFSNDIALSPFKNTLWSFSSPVIGFALAMQTSRQVHLQISIYFLRNSYFYSYIQFWKIQNLIFSIGFHILSLLNIILTALFCKVCIFFFKRSLAETESAQPLHALAKTGG